MRTNKLFHVASVIVGSGVVYVACSASSGAGERKQQKADASVGDGSSGSDAPTDSSYLDAVADVLGIDSPVTDAKAAPPTIVTANCDLAVPSAAGSFQLYAVADFPGQSVDDLARAYYIAERTTVTAPEPPGFSYSAGHATYISPGKVAINCGNEISGTKNLYYKSVKFVLPPPL